MPLDATKNDSRVLALSLSSRITFSHNEVKTYIFEEHTKMIKDLKLLSVNEDANVLVTQLTMVMHNRHLKDVQEEETTETLLLPSRINLDYDKLARPQEDSDITNIYAMVEPLNLKIGFREVDNFKDIQQLFEDLAKSLSGEDEEGKDISYEDYQTKLRRKEAMIEEEEKKQKALENQPRKIPLRERKRKQLILTNMRVVVNKLKISLMDDTGLQEYPLASFSINNVNVLFSTETGQDDVVVFLLRKMGIYQYPVLKLQAELHLLARYFNLENGAYEPLIEPWDLEATIKQKDNCSAMIIRVNSDVMLNINLTYGMALAIKQILTRLEQSSENWVNEKRVEEMKQFAHQATFKRIATYTPREQKPGNVRTTEIPDTGDQNEESEGFYFENNLGVPLKVTIANFYLWREKGIDLSRKENYDKEAVVDFTRAENSNNKYFRKLRTLQNINRYVRKKENVGKSTRNFEDPIVKVDIYIKGMKPIKGVSIELAGLQSFELTLEEETDKEGKNRKFQFVIIVDVHQSGIQKVVSFESQVIMTNNTEYIIEIAHVLLNHNNQNEEEITEEEVKQSIEIAKNSPDKRKSINPQFQGIFDYEHLEIFDEVAPNEEFRIPLKWFLEEVAIYYKSSLEETHSYRLLLPDIKKTFLLKDPYKNPYEDLPKYYLLHRDRYDITFFAMEVKVNKCKPTALDRPPQYN